MKKICQIILPQWARTFGVKALEEIEKFLPRLVEDDFTGVYLIALWNSDVDNGFGVVSYEVSREFTDMPYNSGLISIIKTAHALGLEVGVDVVPNHVSDKHLLAQNCLKGVPGYEDALYVVTEEEAARLTAAGALILFGKEAYSEVEGFKGLNKFVRNTFCDGRQLNLNWNSHAVQDYFRCLFSRLKGDGVDFVRVDCSILLHEDITKANPDQKLACINAEKSVKAIRDVAGDMPLYHEWFGGPFSPDILNDDPLSYALDCSYVLFGLQPTEWTHPKLVPVLGGHDQMPFMNRAKLQGFNEIKVYSDAVSAPSGIIFSDIATECDYMIPESEMEPTEEDKMYDADITNKNRRYLGRRPIKQILDHYYLLFGQDSFV